MPRRRSSLHSYRVSYRGIDGKVHAYVVRSESLSEARSAAYLRHGHDRAHVEHSDLDKSSRDASRAHKAWEVWTRSDRYGHQNAPVFVEAYADKGEAQRKVARLRRSHPYARYMLKHRRVAAARTFGTRGHRRSRATQARRWRSEGY